MKLFYCDRFNITIRAVIFERSKGYGCTRGRATCGVYSRHVFTAEMILYVPGTLTINSLPHMHAEYQEPYFPGFLAIADFNLL